MNSGSCGQRVDLFDGGVQCARHVRVSGLVEAHVGVADLHEMEFALGGFGILAEGAGAQNAAADGPEDAGSGPSHAFEESAAVDAVVVVIVNDAF